MPLTLRPPHRQNRDGDREEKREAEPKGGLVRYLRFEAGIDEGVHTSCQVDDTDADAQKPEWALDDHPH